MTISLSPSACNRNLGFSVFDQLSFSDQTLPFGSIVSGERIRESFARQDALFGYGEDDLWNTGVTLWAFIGQLLQDGKQRSCNAAVTHTTRYLLEQGLEPPSPDSGEYCRARQKLDASVLRQLVRQIAKNLSKATPDNWLWQGKQVKLVDGFTFTMPDTPDNQAVFPQIDSQPPGVGFPLARACAVLSLAHAAIEHLAIGPYAGKETGETALLRRIFDSFNPGEVMLSDRFFCSFFMLALLKTHQVDVCMRLHQMRKIDPTQVKWLGDNDYIDIWHRPAKAQWMSPELYESIPERMAIRVVTFESTTGEQTEPLEVVTTLLDPDAYPAHEIGRLYGYRWHAELDIFAIKRSLNLNHLRCKTPEMVQRELWTTLLAYNLVRLVCAQAAAVYDILPRRMSFTLGCNVLLSQWLMPPKAAIRKELGHYNLFQIACNEVGDRPGRIEPRVIKRRLIRYPLMTQPREHYKTARM